MNLGPSRRTPGCASSASIGRATGSRRLKPGRSIADWVPDGLAVADHLGIQRFVAVGVSTGGAYALALAANAPERVQRRGRLLRAHRHALGRGQGDDDASPAPATSGTRRTATRRSRSSTETFGADGSKMFCPRPDRRTLPPADLALMADPAFMGGMLKAIPEMFANGVQAYVDDRLADGPGWGSFDVAQGALPGHGAARRARLDRPGRTRAPHRVDRARREAPRRRPSSATSASWERSSTRSRRSRADGVGGFTWRERRDLL